MLRSLVLPLSVVLLVSGCGLAGWSTPGNDETDRIARVVSDAISWPRQDTAMGLARAASGTTAGRDGRLTVVEVAELDAATQEEPFAELMFRVHLEGSTAGWVETDPVTACYRVEFDFYGVEGSPRRTDCPADAAPVDIPAAPPPGPSAEIPDGADAVLRTELRRLPPAPDAGRLAATVAGSLPVSDQGLPPDVEVDVDGGDVGISVRGDDACLLGARIAGRVEVWQPSDVLLQPGELTCDPQTALATWGQDPPH